MSKRNDVKMLSIVSPVYGAENILDTLVQRLEEECDKLGMPYEIVLVEDRGPDNSWQKIKEIAATHKRVKGFRLSKNFGQHAAITAGISLAKGDYILTMDCDLQDNPAYIPRFIEKASEGYNIVCSVKEAKKHSLFRRISAGMFFTLVNKLSDVKLEPNLGTMTLIDRTFANEFLKIKDYHRHSSLVFAWLGFNRAHITVKHDPRHSGKSSYNFTKLLRHAINGIVSQSQKLLNFSIGIGLAMVGISVLAILVLFILSFFISFDKGWPSLVLTMLFTTGIILFILGIQGIYIGKVFEQSKERPIFIIQEAVNNEINELEEERVAVDSGS